MYAFAYIMVRESKPRLSVKILVLCNGEYHRGSLLSFVEVKARSVPKEGTPSGAGTGERVAGADRTAGRGVMARVRQGPVAERKGIEWSGLPQIAGDEPTGHARAPPSQALCCALRIKTMMGSKKHTVTSGSGHVPLLASAPRYTY